MKPLFLFLEGWSLKELIQQIEALIGPKLQKNGFEIVEIQYRPENGQWILRIFMDRMELETSLDAHRPGSTVTLEDCSQMSSLIGYWIDTSDLIHRPYQLEVSSPGVNRRLTKEADYIRFLGQKIKVHLAAPLNELSKQKNFSGRLCRCENQKIEIEDGVAGKVTIPLSAVVQANLDVI
jgi:ribosome maturation factor RimP